MTKQERQTLAEDLARAALDWVSDALDDGDFGIPYALEHDDGHVRYCAQTLVDVLERQGF
jgi:hypothetical protein